jgi:hypothetical protein
MHKRISISLSTNVEMSLLRRQRRIRGLLCGLHVFRAIAHPQSGALAVLRHGAIIRREL